MNLGARYQVHPHVQLFVQVNNLLDHHYYTAATLGATGFTAQGTFIARPLPAVGGRVSCCQLDIFLSRRSHRCMGRNPGHVLAKGHNRWKRIRASGLVEI